MQSTVSADQFIEHGIAQDKAQHLTDAINGLLADCPPEEAWSRVSKEVLDPTIPFSAHRFVFDAVFSAWDQDKLGPPPAWTPTDAVIKQSNIGKLLNAKGSSTYAELFSWAHNQREEFWQEMIDKLNIVFDHQPSSLVDLSQGVDQPNWLPGSKLNITKSCFPEDMNNKTAIVYQKPGEALKKVSYQELEKLANRVANSLVKLGLKPGDSVGIDMLMTVEAVAIYLGTIKAGVAPIGIADSFAADEIATRLRIGKAKAIFTQDVIERGGKQLPMYEKVCTANAPQAIVLSAGSSLAVKLRDQDCSWQDFLVDGDQFEPFSADPTAVTNILFSSGTTGDPKAIPWTHTTPIKCAADAYLHHDVQPGDVLAWPTSLGWMMGPWLIYAALMNRASLALYYGVPTGADFAKFVQQAGITMLGVVPSLVKAWKNSDATKDCDWSAIKVFSSTGECSNFEDMLYLMSTAGYKPVIEYCGGTEIGGGFATGTVVQPASPATFSTPALGLDLAILDDNQKPADVGELFVVPPSIGLSTTLLNRDHHDVYFAGTPKGPDGEQLRRHGDQMQRLPGGYIRAHGRADDTMNLGGIKTSSADIERVVNLTNGIVETAAIAANPKGGGPSMLVIYGVKESGSDLDPENARVEMQKRIKTALNPLFKIHEVVFIDKLPRTASNKVMRRVLRGQYQQS